MTAGSIPVWDIFFTKTYFSNAKVDRRKYSGLKIKNGTSISNTKYPFPFEI